MTHSTIMDNVVDAEEAIREIPSDATITISGLGNILCPEYTLSALEEAYVSTRKPSNLTVFTPIRSGNKETGLEHLTHEGLLKRLVTGSFNTATQPGISKMVSENKIEAYAFPMGISFLLLEHQAADSPGLLTKVGLGTYIDPRQKGGKYNEITDEDLVKVKQIDGEEYLLYRTFPIDVAIIKGTTIDRRGNLTLENEPNNLGVLAMAMAARNSGGSVIAQAKRTTECTHRDARSVAVPGTLIDHIVINPDQKQLLGKKRPEEALTGRIHRDLRSDDLDNAQNLELRKRIILHRALDEVSKNDLVNLGVGMPVHLPQVAKEHGVFDDVTFTTEHGLIGGTPNPSQFGSHYNPEAMLKSPEIFRLYQGGSLDISFLGLAQIDREGNVNNSNFAGMLRGPGGFIDITNCTDTIVFCGSLTAGELSVSIEDGTLNLQQEGKHRKFLNEIEEVTLNADIALQQESEIKIITERGCFDITTDGITLTEIAPGMDIDRDIRNQIAFDIDVNDDLPEYNLRVLDRQ